MKIIVAIIYCCSTDADGKMKQSRWWWWWSSSLWSKKYKNGQTPAADYVGILCKDGNNDAGIYPKW